MLLKMLQLHISKTGTLNHNTEYYSSACFPAITSYRVSVVVYITTNFKILESVLWYRYQNSILDSETKPKESVVRESAFTINHSLELS